MVTGNERARDPMARQGDRPPESGSRGAVLSSRAGFSVVELLVALMILTVGLLALAGGMGIVVGSVTESDVKTERTAAFQSALENLRAEDFDDLDSGNDSIGAFEVEWTVQGGNHWKGVEVVVTGPGRTSASAGIPIISQAVADTFHYTVIRR